MINLLPPEIKQRQRSRSMLYSILLGYVVLAVIVILASLALATYNLTTKVAVTDKTTQLNTLAKERQKNRDLIDKASFIEDRLNSQKALKNSEAWETLLATIASDTASSIQLTSISFDGDDPQAVTFSLAGETADRRDIILMRDKLEENASFEKLTITAITDTVTSGSKRFTFTITGSVSNAS